MVQITDDVPHAYIINSRMGPKPWLVNKMHYSTGLVWMTVGCVTVILDQYIVQWTFNKWIVSNQHLHAQLEWGSFHMMTIICHCALIYRPKPGASPNLGIRRQYYRIDPCFFQCAGNWLYCVLFLTGFLSVFTQCLVNLHATSLYLSICQYTYQTKTVFLF